MEQDAYIILFNQNEERLATDVNHKIAEGYLPLGGVTARTASTQTGYMLYQAMVLKTKLS